MSNVNTIKPEQVGVVATMADKFGMRPDAFEIMVRATCSPAPRRGEDPVPLTREEFAAFMLVANHYDLNPLTREIFAYPKRGGGVVPIVSIDGWLSLINRQPSFDGMDLKANLDERGALLSYTCTMYRKDRSHPVVVTEYLSECVRDTEPWKMKHRMLRHKSLMQCGRYTFGFGGIYDEDEGRAIADAGPSATTAPSTRRLPPAPPPVTLVDPVVGVSQAEAPNPEPAAKPSPHLPPNPNKAPAAPPKPAQPVAFDFDAFRAALMAATTQEDANAIYEVQVEKRAPALSEDEGDEADSILRECCSRFWVEG